MSESDLAEPLPPPPPRSADERGDWLRLFRSYRVGPSTFYRLLADHGSARAALGALPEVARSAGVSQYRPCSEDQARAELRAGNRAGAQLVAIGEPDYPTAIAQLSGAPPLLWMIGDASLGQRPAVGLVGTRQSTSLGLRMARALAEDLGRAGYVIASGLARGIDTAAHQGALASGTIAVMPGGVDVIYPAENAALAAELGKSGLRISDQPMGLAPQARHFARRNRLIAGLSAAVVVVEAPERSGALITAQEALEAGRDVLAVPGHPMDSRVSGCNRLIRDGAVLVRSAADILEVLHLRGVYPALPRAQAPAKAAAAPPEPLRHQHGPTAGSDQDPKVVAIRNRTRTGPSDTAEQGRLLRTESSHPPVSPSLGLNDAPSADRKGPSRAQEVGEKPDLDQEVDASCPEPAPRVGVKDRIAAKLAAPAGDLAQRILLSLGLAPLSEDQLSRDLGLSPSKLGQELLAMELDGRLERRPGGLLCRLP